MFEKFSDYMYSLLFTPLKKVRQARNQFYLFFKVVGRLFDDTKADIFRVREESIVASASEIMLAEHGKDRDMPRLKGENLEGYRTRLSMKALIAERAGTDQGILLALAALGYTRLSIERMSTYDPERWAEFMIIINYDITEEPILKLSVMRNEVRKVKPASAKDNYMYCFHATATHDIKSEGSLMIESFCYPFLGHPPLLLDGNWILNGTYELSGEQGNKNENQSISDLSISIESVIKLTALSDISAIVENELWYLDGSELLNGDRTLSADIYEWEFNNRR